MPNINGRWVGEMQVPKEINENGNWEIQMQDGSV